jgi:hypothetical protein
VPKFRRPCGNSAQHLRSSVFFHANHGKWPSLESRCSYLAFFGKFFFLPLKSASFHTVSKNFAPNADIWAGFAAGLGARDRDGALAPDKKKARHAGRGLELVQGGSRTTGGAHPLALPLDRSDDAAAATLNDVVPVTDEHDLAVPDACDQAHQRGRAVDQLRHSRR